jgi:subtilisin family serine protease
VARAQSISNQTSIASAQGPSPAAFSPSVLQETLNLQLQPGEGRALLQLMPLITAAGATAQMTQISGLYELRGPAENMGQLAAQLSTNLVVGFVSPMQVIHVANALNDPDYVNGKQWALNGVWGINAPTAWNTMTGSTHVIVADVDTGMNYNHPDLYNNVWINQAEIPNPSVLPNLTDTNGDGLITFTDLNNSVNQWSGKIVDTNNDGLITGAT